MQQAWALLAVTVVVVSARPQGPRSPRDVDPDSPQPYEYHYEVNVPETGDQKSHTEERDEAGVVVGNFQVVDPNGDLRKLFYRVEGNSGFVITDQQVMVGFAPPPPDPSTYSTRQSADIASGSSSGSGSQTGGGVAGGSSGATSDGGAGEGDGLTSDQFSSAGADQFGFAGDGQGLFLGSSGGDDRFGDGSDGFGFGNGNGGDADVLFASAEGFSTSDGDGGNFIDGGSSSSGDNGDSSGGSSSEGGSSEGGSSEEGAPSSGTDGGLSGSTSGASGGLRIPPITSQVSKAPEIKPFEFHGPAFTFSIQRTRPNRFEVKEKIIGHAVEFNTHGGRERRSAAHLP